MKITWTFYHRFEFWYWVLFGAAFLGLLTSGYLWYEYSLPTPIGCSVIGGCEQVRVSDYSKLFGVSLPIYGTAFYLVLAGFASTLSWQRKKWKYEHLLLFAYTGIGFVMSAYFTYLEIFVIHAICQWCVISAVSAILCFGAATEIFILSRGIKN